MLFTNDVLFIHVPKTGGMSITQYLINNLRGEIRLSLPAGAFDHARSTIEFPDAAERLTLLPGRRHETLPQAKGILESLGLKLADFKVIFAVGRNPYDLEVSHFKHLQKDAVVERRGADSPATKVALSGDLERFSEEVAFFGGQEVPIERYYTIAGKTLPNFTMVRFESMAEDIPSLVAPYSFQRMAMPHRNKTPRRVDGQYILTERMQRALTNKYRYLFLHYEPRGLGESFS